MNPFLKQDNLMEVEEISLDDISMDTFKSNFQHLKAAAPDLINEARLSVKASLNEFTNFSDRMKDLSKDLNLDNISFKPSKLKL
jgi:hypothetical protein